LSRTSRFLVRAAALRGNEGGPGSVSRGALRGEAEGAGVCHGASMAGGRGSCQGTGAAGVWAHPSRGRCRQWELMCCACSRPGGFAALTAGPGLPAWLWALKSGGISVCL